MDVGIIGVLGGTAGVVISAMALYQSKRANEIACLALDHEKLRSKVLLHVEPRMVVTIGDDVDERPRPIVNVINLSQFPVTVSQIHWKIYGGEDAGWFFWKNPDVSAPYSKLPARLDPRTAVTAIGVPTTFKGKNQLLAVEFAVAITECGEQFMGMSDQWREFVAGMDD